MPLLRGVRIVHPHEPMDCSGFCLCLIILVSTAFALTKGLVREIISLVALVVGFILAAFYYRVPAALFSDLTRTGRSPT